MWKYTLPYSTQSSQNIDVIFRQNNFLMCQKVKQFLKPADNLANSIESFSYEKWMVYLFTENF
jgi:hypothetical protein